MFVTVFGRLIQAVCGDKAEHEFRQAIVVIDGRFYLNECIGKANLLEEMGL